MDGDEDLISTLPDSVLGEIVTLLPTADAVRVQILSTRWHDIWHSSPLNLNLDLHSIESSGYKHLVSAILEAHPGPGRRIRLEWPYNHGQLYRRWLRNPALNGLQELEIEPGYPRNWASRRPLPERAVFRFALSLRVLKIGYHAFPSDAGAVAALRFPHLEFFSLCCVDISEGTLQGVLAGCPVLKTLILDLCTGLATVRINSSTITSFAISTADICYNRQYCANLTGRVTPSQVIIEDAPLLEKLVPCRRSTTDLSFRLRVVCTPRLRVLGSLSSTIHKLEIGSGTVFESTTQRVYRVRPGKIMVEKRSLMQTTMLATALRSVKILAVEDVGSVDVVINYLRCFPCTEKLYVSVSQEFTSTASYDKGNPIECLEQHLKMVALHGYEGKRPHIKFAKFFIRNARLLQLVKFRIYGYFFYFLSGATNEWIADQQKQLQTRNMASQNVKFHFVRAASLYNYQGVYCGENINDLAEHIHDSSRNDPFDQWFQSEKEAWTGMLKEK